MSFTGFDNKTGPINKKLERKNKCAVIHRSTHIHTTTDAEINHNAYKKQDAAVAPEVDVKNLTSLHTRRPPYTLRLSLLSARLVYAITQTRSVNPGSPLLLRGAAWVTAFWRGSPQEALSSHRTPGTAWLTAAKCKSSAIIQSFCCTYTGRG